MVSRQLHNTIKSLIIKGIQKNSQRIFDRSQDTAGCHVPVLTGKLKLSGFVRPHLQGAVIGYAAPYSSDVEFGREARPIEEVQTIYVPSHRKKNGTVVKGFYKQIKGRIIAFQPKISKFERGDLIYRHITEEPALKGQFFLSRAIVKEIPSLLDDMEFYFKSIGKTSSINTGRIIVNHYEKGGKIYY